MRKTQIQGFRLTFGQFELNGPVEHWNYIYVTNIVKLTFKKKALTLLFAIS